MGLAKVNGHRSWFILDTASQGFRIDRDYVGKMHCRAASEAVSDELDRKVLSRDYQT